MSLKSKEYHLLRNYGISLSQYNSLRRKQKYSCAVCKRHESEFKISLAVDHDHKTGEIYGLLCYYCNRFRIGRNHDLLLANSIAKYLKKGTGLYVPVKIK